MWYKYDNKDSHHWFLDYYSEIERRFDDPCDWTEAAVKVLTLFFYGDPDNHANDTERMYVGLQDSRGPVSYAQVDYGFYGEDMNDIRIAEWHEWNIALEDFNKGGLHLTDVNKIYIGFGIRGNPYPDGIPGGTGIVYFDDIRLYLPQCFPKRAKPIGDLTDDCVVDYKDLKIIADNWLVSPNEPNEPNNPVGWWKLDENDGSIAHDSSLYAWHGTIVGDYSWVPGCGNSAVEFIDGKVVVPDAPHLRPPTQVSVSAWVNYSVAPPYSARIVVKGADNKETYLLEVDEHDTIAFIFRDVNSSWHGVDGTMRLPHYEWVHIAGTYDGYNISCYVDGEHDSSDTIGPALLSQDVNDLAIANRADANDRQFEGAVDEVRIYDYGLSHNEVLWVGGECGLWISCGFRPNLYCNGRPLPDYINFRDYAVLAAHWLEQVLWPPEE
jgi:hypothetical protein